MIDDHARGADQVGSPRVFFGSQENPVDNGDTTTIPGADPMTRFWTDMVGRMAATSMSAPPASQEMIEQMRSAFLDVLSRHTDEFLRSEQFLAAMKQSMDSALAFRQQLNELLTKSLETLQMPTSSDVVTWNNASARGSTNWTSGSPDWKPP